MKYLEKLTDKNNIIDEMLGTQISEKFIAEKYDIDKEEILDILLDANIERCPSCNTWVECQNWKIKWLRKIGH